MISSYTKPSSFLRWAARSSSADLSSSRSRARSLSKATSRVRPSTGKSSTRSSIAEKRASASCRATQSSQDCNMAWTWTSRSRSPTSDSRPSSMVAVRAAIVSAATSYSAMPFCASLSSFRVSSSSLNSRLIAALEPPALNSSPIRLSNRFRASGRVFRPVPRLAP